MELRHLRYFIAVAEELHFGRAAARLSIAQPPLSHQIRQLEGELGVLLFERNRNGVRLTEGGRSFLSDARRMLATLEESVGRARLASGGHMGQLRVGYVGTPKLALVRALERHKTSAGVHVSLEEVTFDELVAAIYNNRIDIGVFRAWMPTTAVHTEVIDSGVLWVALPNSHRLASLESVPLTTLAAEEFIVFKRTVIPGYLERLSMACAEAGFVPNISQEVFSAHSALSFVAAGIAVAVVPASTSELTVPGVAYRPLVEPVIEVPIVAAWRPESPSPLVRDFVNLISSETRHT